MMSSIINDQLVMPQSIPKEAWALVSGLLNKDPAKWLGSQAGFEEIKKSQWF